ncbi:uncharacterized protein B0J16DRAFT_312390 [Fusarium flagelliforme]|uniref:BZIP domain-containing protein n=1 Tax=Fusarium flagelliforme TaxID=2675880 RepID=A0A395MFK2_9HYPO|nr:uncharacterized protein B0J16DRAFT_312390 [Fusarium flagelliforme]KAH7169758.1 hypothetical protein B0J16DRAFT_312390 [Fusarium flagelliforme]RFN46053.1 hypothetical protein FIE12Z_9704 [Fusarium flagelliforme]
MGGDSASGTSYTPESLLWEQWWPSNQLVPIGLSEDKSGTTNSVYTQTGPLIDSSRHDDNTELKNYWHYINYEMIYIHPGNGLNLVIEDIPLFPVSEHGIPTEAPGQGHWHSHSTQMTPNRKTNCCSDNLTPRKSTERTRLGDRDINPQIKKTGKRSAVRRTRNTNSNGAHQQSSDRIKRTQEQNKIAANKLRAKKREQQQGLKFSKQDLECIHRDLSTCVADLTFKVYELKMQLLQQSECNCTLMQNYLVHESSRYVQALEGKSQ